MRRTPLQIIAQALLLPIEAWLTFCEFIDDSVHGRYGGASLSEADFFSLLLRALFTIVYWLLAADLVVIVASAFAGRWL